MFTSLLAQSSSGGAGDILGPLGAMFCCCGFILILVLPMTIGQYKIFAKAGKPGWAAFVPIYNLLVMLEMIGQPASRFIFYLIPFYNIVVAFQDCVALARCFGKDTGFAIGLIFLPFVFIPILGFGSAQYTPPGGMGGGYAPPPRPGMPPRR